MTTDGETTTTIAERAPVLPTPVTPAGTTPLAGVDLPDDYDPSREFFPGCAVPPTEARYEFPEGPPSPLSRTLADVVKAIAG